MQRLAKSRQRPVGLDRHSRSGHAFSVPLQAQLNLDPLPGQLLSVLQLLSSAIPVSMPSLFSISGNSPRSPLFQSTLSRQSESDLSASSCPPALDELSGLQSASPFPGISDLLKDSAFSSASPRLLCTVLSASSSLPWSISGAYAVNLQIDRNRYVQNRALSDRTPRLPPPLRAFALRFTASTLRSPTACVTTPKLPRPMSHHDMPAASIVKYRTLLIHVSFVTAIHATVRYQFGCWYARVAPFSPGSRPNADCRQRRFPHTRQKRQVQNGAGSCDSNNLHGLCPETAPQRGYLNKLLLACTISAFIFQAQTSPLAYIALNRQSLNPGKLPPDWQIKVSHGRPDVSTCSGPDGPCLHLKSASASFGLERSVDVDLALMPYLTWSWKVAQLPPSGDFRHASTDDQAAQVLVAFGDRHILSYIWDSTAPKGTVQSASFIPLVHVFDIVCQSGAADVNRWIAENHNVAADYQRAYGKPASRVKGLRIQINSQHTGATAESYFGEVAFRSAPQ
jgi:hypothetical protein